MSKWIAAVIVAVLTYSLTGCGQILPSGAVTSSKSTDARMSGSALAQQELLVKFKSQVNASSIRTFHVQYGTRTVRVIPGLNVHVMSITSGKPMAQVLAQVSQSPMVEYAEPNNPINVNDDRPRL